MCGIFCGSGNGAAIEIFTIQFNGTITALTLKHVVSRTDLFAYGILYGNSISLPTTGYKD